MNNEYAAGPSFEWKTNGLSVCLFERKNLPFIQADFDTYLYLTPKHLETQTEKEIYYFFLFRARENTAAAIFQCISDDTIHFLSPARAPFGGIQCDDKCSSSEVNFLMECIHRFSYFTKKDKIITTNAPTCYNLTTSNLLMDCYQKNGYREVKRIVNHAIPVTSQLYVNIIHHSEVRRLNKCKSAGFVVELLENPDMNAIHHFLRSCRNEKGYSISLSAVQLEQIRSNCPGNIWVFVVKDQGQTAALTLAIQVNKQILYNFLSASLTVYNAYSPVVLVTEAIYLFCQKKNITILDLGTSLDSFDIEKPGLIRFKENLGGVAGYKSTFMKIL